ncbi:hypothetical protein [Marinomonas foliarum]|uniref:Uncharacterized protein n=2 Tax=root TaxID=1 RepID=A0A899IRL6_9VIRU|nr:hypothetical protein [Marinomonas foliarum]QRV22799.1 hypothetical protein JSY38_12045 [Marinomonas foliarum]QSM01478.1 hypothetical protein [Marinomonas phage MfV]
MRHTQILQAGGRWNVTAIGEYIHYEKGAGEIELEVDGEMHQLAVRDTFIMPEGYQGFKVLNLDNSAGEFSFLTGRGQLKVAASGQLTEVSGIASTVDVNLLNSVKVSSMPAVKVAEMPAVQVTQLPAVNVATMPVVEVSTMPAVEVSNTVDIRPITETLKNRPDSGATFSANEFVIDAGLSVSLSAEPLRKELLILAGDSNADEIVINGLAVGAGDSFALDNFGGSLTITGAESDSFKVCEVLYEA